MLVIDPKAELSNLTAAHRADTLKTNVFLLDPFLRTDPSLAYLRTSYNPMSILTPESETLAEDAGLIADAIVTSEEGRNQFFSDGAKAFIEALLLHVATHENYDGRRNLITVRRLIHNLESQELMKEMDGNTAADEIIQGAVADFWERGDDERGSLGSTIRRNTKFLDYRAMQRVLL